MRSSQSIISLFQLIVHRQILYLPAVVKQKEPQSLPGAAMFTGVSLTLAE